MKERSIIKVAHIVNRIRKNKEANLYQKVNNIIKGAVLPHSSSLLEEVIEVIEEDSKALVKALKDKKKDFQALEQ